MTIICPKCHQARPADATVPDWQCPSCGVAYAKAQDSSGAAAADSRSTRPAGWVPSRTEPDRTWVKVVMALLLVTGGYLLWNQMTHRFQGLGGGQSAEDIARLASSVKEGDVVMYTTSTCPYCVQARGWLSQNGFAFTECNIETHSQCNDAMRSYRANGVPFLVVKGQQMHEGFNSEQFLNALKQ